MIKNVYSGSVDYLQVMDENGKVDGALRPTDIGDDKLIELYRWMSLSRAVDAKVISLQRQGRATTYAPLLGQEATQIGTAAAMSAKDILVPNFRQHGSLLFRGLSLYDFFVYWKGYEDGLVSTKKMNSTPYIVPVSTHLVHAVGIAFTHKYLGTGASVLTYVGDGGTSEGDFYEALNFAGVMKVPIVFVIENNQWAISTPVRKQTAASTLAQKGIAAGMVCTQVDGNDVMAVYKATKESLANTPKGPSLIECLTYRLSFHTTSDDPTKYRTEAEVEDWKKRDPIKRVRLYLESKQLWNASKQQTMEDEQLKTINGAVSKADTFKPDPKSMFETLYSSIPDTLKDEETDALNSGFWQEGTNPV